MPKRHGHSDHHGGSGKSRQTQEDYEIFDYDLCEEEEETGASSTRMIQVKTNSDLTASSRPPIQVRLWSGLIQSYTISRRTTTTSRPSLPQSTHRLSFLNPDQVPPPMTQSNPISKIQIMTHGLTTNQAQPSSSTSAEYPHKCPREGCDRSYRIESQLTKHLKTHDKPLKCKADKNCKVRQAQQRDMDRHYRTAHKKYAEKQGILEEPSKCRLCGETFTRPDNLHKHMKKKHS
ncbi:hypothetical protein QQZ08_003372 [Neonectria magnoliae]|uniref:C2H2-type domain-containing protein n=1 Tax=Neonectria magnoliae TaxID=2732573 RepID=A0ABR1IBM9_9HYPO